MTNEIIVYIGLAIIFVVIVIPKRLLIKSSKPIDRAVLRFREWVFR